MNQRKLCTFITVSAAILLSYLFVTAIECAAQAVPPKNPAAIRWSPVIGRIVNGTRSINPAPPSAITAAQLAFRPWTGTLPINARPAIAFKACNENVNPSTGQPTDPNTLITLPSGDRVTVRQFCAEYNLVESNLNRYGYSLNEAQDASTDVVLGAKPPPLLQTGIRPLNLAVATNALAAKKLSLRSLAQIAGAQKLPTEPKTPVPIGQKPNDISNLRYSVNGPGYSKSIAANQFAKGDPSIFAVYADASGALRADVKGMSITNTVSIDISLMGLRLQMARLTSTTNSPIMSDNARAESTLMIFGKAQPVPPMPAAKNLKLPSVPFTSMSPAPSSDYNHSTRIEANFDSPWSFSLAGVPMYFAVGAAAGLGFTSEGVIAPKAISNDLRPEIFADAYMAGGVDILIAQGGVECQFNLINAWTTVHASLTRDTESLKSKLGYTDSSLGYFVTADYFIYRGIQALSGDINLFLRLRYPCWPKIICSKKYTYTLVHWNGWTDEGFSVPQDAQKWVLAAYADGLIPGWNR